MNAKKCDRCHCYYDIEPTTKLFISKRNGLFWENLDLCQKCNDELIKFMATYEDNKEEE